MHVIRSRLFIFLTDYARASSEATEGDLRQAETRQQETPEKSYAKTVWMQRRYIDVTHGCRGEDNLSAAMSTDSQLPWKREDDDCKARQGLRALSLEPV
jgi:hypothetical protein